MNNEELRKKIIDIIHDTEICSVENNCDTCKYGKELMNYKDTSCRTLRAADNLIASEIGDVAEWKRRVNDYKQRAEVAEKERNECERKTEIAQKAGKIIQRDMLRVFGSENPVTNDKINALWDLALQRAEREIEENALRQALLTVEEERKDD